MYLGPHHFQAQARYFEDAIQFASSSLYFAGYGLAACELDAEALENGTLSLIRARGILPDGLPFEMPDCDPLPEPRHITDLFPALAERLTVYLGIPAYRDDAVTCALPEAAVGGETRYVAQLQQLHDENTGRDEKPVHLGPQEHPLLPRDGAYRGPGRTPRGASDAQRRRAFRLRPRLHPAVVQITASERLMAILRRLIDILEEKGEAFRRLPAKSGDMAAAFSQQEVATFWFLHAVNSSLVMLRNLCFSKRGHPEEVFAELSRLAGALCTFGLDSHAGKPSALRPPASGRVLRRAGQANPIPAGKRRPDQLRLDSAQARG